MYLTWIIANEMWMKWLLKRFPFGNKWCLLHSRTEAQNAEAKLHAPHNCLLETTECGKHETDGHTVATLINLMLIFCFRCGVISSRSRRRRRYSVAFVVLCVCVYACIAETHSFNFWKIWNINIWGLFGDFKMSFISFVCVCACFMGRKWTNREDRPYESFCRAAKIQCSFSSLPPNANEKEKCKKCAPLNINKRIINGVKYDGMVALKGKTAGWQLAAAIYQIEMKCAMHAAIVPKYETL